MKLNAEDVRYSVSIGILGNIIPNIRRIAARWGEDSLHLLFYIDGEVTEFVDDVSLEIMQDTSDQVPDEQIEVSYETVRCDFPEIAPKHLDEENAIIAYARYERYPQDTDTPYPPLKE